jgi:outer membrane beta-barrel protein
MKYFLFALGALSLLPAQAAAQETIDVGVLKESEIAVVQNLLYSKKDATELGAHLGWMPFDAFTTTPLGSFTGVKHQSETIAYELALGGGYGLKNSAYRTLEGEAYAIAPDAYRYLGSLIADVQYSPIYAKMNWQGNRVFHHDVYGLLGAGLTVEQAIIPDKDLSFGPTASVGVGARIFLSQTSALRIQLRDDVLIQSREKTTDSRGVFIKQNLALTVGYVRLKK